MTDLYNLLRYEEGWRPTPYLCSEGYPTVGYGIKIGPKGAHIKNYTFTLPENVGDLWMATHINAMLDEFEQHQELRCALAACLIADGVTDPDLYLQSPRAAVLISMAFQMGVQGLLCFQQTLKFIGMQSWSNVSANMLKSLWAGQTPERAKRHAEQMRTGVWASPYSA